MSEKHSRPFLKKKHGQHFLKDEQLAHVIVSHAPITHRSSILEIGPGDGMLTRHLLQSTCKQLWAFEIDHEWVEYVEKRIHDERLTLFSQDILTADFSIFSADAPWICVSNLAYAITFPMLHAFLAHRHLFSYIILMLQEEVAQKLIAGSGRSYGFVSLYFQYYFSFTLLEKVAPSSFYPKPKVFSRLIAIVPKKKSVPIKEEKAFWSFIRSCFKQPRRTLKNNLQQTDWDIETIPTAYHTLRAQQIAWKDFLTIWQTVIKHSPS